MPGTFAVVNPDISRECEVEKHNYEDTSSLRTEPGISPVRLAALSLAIEIS